MSSILDNPIWNALNSGSKMHSLGNDRVRYMQRDMGLFVGFKTYCKDEWRDLEKWLPENSQIILFTRLDITVPASWELKIRRPLFQMIYDSQDVPDLPEHQQVVTLVDKDVPAMLDLTKLTNPGPFFPKTIALGHFGGMFEGERLVAMSGQRLQPDPYVEVSAVCTHPDFVGKGFAAALVSHQVGRILAESKIPFLHVNSDNFSAIRLYEKLGFRLRTEIDVYFLERLF